jgi:hypothetical protein
LRASASAIAADRDDKWNAVAARMHEEGYCTNPPTTKIAVVLRYLYDQRPPMSLRARVPSPRWPYTTTRSARSVIGLGRCWRRRVLAIGEPIVAVRWRQHARQVTGTISRDISRNISRDVVRA